MQPSENLAALNARFLDMWNIYSTRARVWKRLFIWSRVAAIVLTWSNLMFGVAALSWLQGTAFVDFWLKTILFWSSICGLVLTAFELMFGPEQHWLLYRQAEQHLSHVAMWYRGSVMPLHDPEYLDAVRLYLDEINKPIKGRRSLRELVINTVSEYRLPAVPEQNYTAIAPQGLVPLFGDNADSYLDGRLRDQRRWFLSKAHLNRTRYFAFQSGILAVNAFNSIWSKVKGEEAWLPIMTTLAILALYELRDFFDPSTLWRRYRLAAQELTDIEQAFQNGQHPFHTGDSKTRVQRLVQNVENCLAAEFQVWMLAKQQKTEQSMPQVDLAAEYVPHPLVTTNVAIPSSLVELGELLAKNIHENWSKTRVDEGWRYGPARNDSRKEHPCLVPYERLPEQEKEYDRVTATQTLKTILVLGYRIEQSN